MDVDNSDCWKSEAGEGAFGGQGSVISPTGAAAAAQPDFNAIYTAPGFGDMQQGSWGFPQPFATTFAQAFMHEGSSGGVYQRPMNQFATGWGQSAEATRGLQVKKRNAIDAELVEYAEVGFSQEDPEVGHNAPKIRTMDFDEAATMTKDGYIVDDAFEAYEKRKMDEWGPSLTEKYVMDERHSMQEGNSFGTIAALKQRNAQMKKAKRRSQKVDLYEENWEVEVEPRKPSGGSFFEAVL